MFGFGNLLGKLKGAANYSENKDFIEGLCAGIALVAAADGQVTDDEVAVSIDTALRNKHAISCGISESSIRQKLNHYFSIVKTLTGKVELRDELREIHSRDQDGKLCEIIFCIAADVAAADGAVGDKEKEVLREIAGLFRLRLSDYNL